MSGPEPTLLGEGRVELIARIPRSSNAAFLVRVSCGGESCHAVYKPESGERPLSDFAPGLFRRERAAYLLSDYLRWGLVPPTVIRDDSPLGVGSLQRPAPCDYREHYFTLYEDAPETHTALSRIALFDFVANNTDRKSGHVLRGHDGHIWGIDHGLCFSADFKLRTVIWDFAGRGPRRAAERPCPAGCGSAAQRGGIAGCCGDPGAAAAGAAGARHRCPAG